MSGAAGAGSRVRLDLARGVLMAWTRCDAAEAVTQLTEAARTPRVSVFDLAYAVLATAGGARAAAPTTLVGMLHERWAPRTGSGAARALIASASAPQDSPMGPVGSMQ